MKKLMTIIACGAAVATLTLAMPATSYAGHYHGHYHYHGHVGRYWRGYHHYYYDYVAPYYGNPAGAYTAYDTGIVPVVPHTAHIHVMVPANARVWIADTETNQTGADRVFESPALLPGRDYSYAVKAEWVAADGKTVSQTKQVKVQADSDVHVDFNL